MGASLKLLEQYVSGNYPTHLIVEDNKLFFYLPKGKTPDQETQQELISKGWQYSREFNCFFHETLSCVEMLTHDNEKIRNQAQRHAQHLTKLKSG